METKIQTTVTMSVEEYENFKICSDAINKRKTIKYYAPSQWGAGRTTLLIDESEVVSELEKQIQELKDYIKKLVEEKRTISNTPLKKWWQ